MADCECLNGCPFFDDKMANSQGLGKIYKEKYCLGDNRNCARYKVYSRLGSSAVPADLYPNMHDEATNILADAE